MQGSDVQISFNYELPRTIHVSGYITIGSYLNSKSLKSQGLKSQASQVC